MIGSRVRALPALSAWLVLALPAASPAAAAPTRLWYRMHITYSAEVHEHSQYCCGIRNDAGTARVDGRHDENVMWTAHSRGSVLVRYFGHGTWLVNNGVLLGHIERAESSDKTTERYFCWGKVLCTSTGPLLTRDCYSLVERRLPLSGGAFTDPDLLMLVGPHMGATWFPWTSLVRDPNLRAVVHTTGDIDNCEQVNPPPDSIAPYSGELPLAPNFDNTMIELIRDSPPTFTGHGEGALRRPPRLDQHRRDVQGTADYRTAQQLWRLSRPADAQRQRGRTLHRRA